MRATAKLSAWAALLAAVVLLGAGPTPRDPDLDLKSEISRLQKLVKKERSDSLRYELALAERDLGTIDGRRAALELFEDARDTYFNDPRFHWDWALTYEYGGRISDARQTMERVVELDPGDVAARVRIARLWLRELLRVYDLEILKSMEAQLAAALEVNPDDRDALLLMSLTLHMEKSLPDADPPSLTYRGQVCAEKILAADSTDAPALLLLAVHDMDLSRMDAAEGHFLRFLDLAPPGIQEVFRTSERTALAQIVDQVKELDPDKRAQYSRAWWWYRDPSPLTAVNEAQLEYWKRLAEAEFLFGQPERGIHGWDTEPGEAWVRYGQPNARLFDPGSVTGYSDAASKSTIKVNAPAWVWGYKFGGKDIWLKFEDKSLMGTFMADEPTARAMEELRRSTAAVFYDALPGAISTLFASSAGAAGEAGKVRQTLYLAVGPWREPNKDWLKDCRLQLTVRDSAYRKVVGTEMNVLPRHIYRPVPGAEFLVLYREVNVVPGRYFVTAEVEDGDRDVTGSISLALDVRDLAGGDSLRISDLDLALTATPEAGGPTMQKLGRTFVPNPMGMVGDDRNLDVFYEIYNLAVRGGKATYSLRYTVVPRDYAVNYDFHVRRGNARPGTLTTLAEQGVVIGETELTAANYSDLRFPPETAPLDRGATQVKGARVDVSALDPGEYVLVVTVTDETTGGRASAQRMFRIVTDEELRALFAFRK